MAKYDRQLIVAFLDAANDPSTEAQAQALDSKEREEALPSEVVTLRTGAGPSDFSEESLLALSQALAGRRAVSHPVTEQSRIYLIGTGNWQARRLGPWDFEDVAKILVSQGMPSVKVISIVADELGRDLGTNDDSRVTGLMDSFAAVLHRRLRETYGVMTVVQARVYRTVVITSEIAQRFSDLGKKLTGDEGDSQPATHKRGQSKVKLFWEGDTQKWEWAY